MIKINKMIRTALMWLLILWNLQYLVYAEYPGVDDLELTTQSEIIVTGVVVKEKGQWSIQVSEVLKGPEVKIVPFTNPLRFNPPLKEGDNGVFFLGKYSFVGGQGYRDNSKIQSVRVLIQMQNDPGPYLNLAKYPENTDIADTLGEIFIDVKTEQVGTLSRKEAAVYLRKRLHSDNAEIVISAVKALRRMRDSESFPDVLSLLLRDGWRPAFESINFLKMFPERLRDPEVVQKLRAQLDVNDEYYLKMSSVPRFCAEILGRVDDPALVPSLERAASYRILEAVSALGDRGRTESFEIILRAAESYPEDGWLMVDALYLLVSRSNKAIEPWMLPPKRINGTTTINIETENAKILKWRHWWDVNNKDFKVK